LEDFGSLLALDFKLLGLSQLLVMEVFSLVKQEVQMLFRVF